MVVSLFHQLVDLYSAFSGGNRMNRQFLASLKHFKIKSIHMERTAEELETRRILEYMETEVFVQ